MFCLQIFWFLPHWKPGILHSSPCLFSEPAGKNSPAVPAAVRAAAGEPAARGQPWGSLLLRRRLQPGE